MQNKSSCDCVNKAMLGRLIEVIRYSGMTNRDFAKHCEINESSLNACLYKQRGVGLDIVQKICIAFPEINERWLLLGAGEMLDEKVRAVMNRR